MKTPDNLEVFATHGSYTTPGVLEPHIRPEFDARLRRNFSDFATSSLVQNIPEKQCLVPKHGRIAGDPNRATDAEDLFRTTDFNSVQIFKAPLPHDLRDQVLQESYLPYHRAIVQRLLANHGHAQNLVVAFDVHDTGNLLLAEDPENDVTRKDVQRWKMPAVIISDQDGQTAPEGLLTNLKASFEKRFGLRSEDVICNWQFKGGYVTKNYGDPDNLQLQQAIHNRAVVQVELNRSLYVDEKTQELIPSAIEHYRTRLTLIFSEVADGYTHRAKP
ncbi:MAG: N-formylglutamate amidohydrolase [Candidatus Peribacteraceae bacterium]|jgi:N-formylglutamate amidohydrolase